MALTNGNSRQQADVLVIGGGLAGLTAAALVAKAGRSVIVCEQASNLGGRAATQLKHGVHLNLGAHALYRNGRAYRVFTELGVPFSGRAPSPGRALLVQGDKTYRLPQGLVSLLTSGLLTVREKWRMAGLLVGLQKIDPGRFDHASVRDWVTQTAGTGNLAELLFALFRLTSYVNVPERLSAGAALQQLQLALAGNVLYLDDGWQSLVDGLRARAVEHGALIRTGARVESVANEHGGVVVRLASGETLQGRAVVLAVPPDVTGVLLGPAADTPAAQRVAACTPVRAACLDVALGRLPRPERRFALGLDKPLYYSVHSAAAKLAPDGVAVVHLLKYLGDDQSPADVAEREMADLLDRVQPGWRDHVIVRRYLPAMTVANDLPRAADGGLAGRTQVQVHENVFLAGDWVGSEGQLADASAASAAEAAKQALAYLSVGGLVRSASHAAN
jgi:phytoene dehydrogenase-like protein